MKKTYLITVVVCILLVYGITAKISESNFACRSCHSNQYQRWAVSSHMKIDCKDCHIDPGLSGKLEAQINGIRNLFVTIIRGVNIQPHEKPLPISTENCVGCHAAILHLTELGYDDLPDNSLKGQGLRINHRIHVEKYSIECVECHRGIVHRDPEKIGKYRTNWPFMTMDCGPCHDGKFSERFQVEVTSLEDKKKCTVCHPYYEPPPSDDEVNESH